MFFFPNNDFSKVEFLLNVLHYTYLERFTILAQPRIYHRLKK